MNRSETFFFRRMWRSNLPVSACVAAVVFWASTVCGQSPPLHDAAKQGDIAAIRALLDAGAAVDETSGEGSLTALLVATLEGHTKAVRLLLVAGANVEAESGQGETPLTMAAGSGNVGLIKLLLRAGADINRETKIHNEWNTPLTMAARKRGNVLAVIALLRAGANVNTRAIGGALYQSAAEGDVEVLTALLSAGADADAERDPSAVESVLMGCVCPDEYQDDTALHAAALGRQAYAIRLLLASGANVNVESKGTPLFYAAASECSECVKELLDGGADEVVNREYASPFGLWAHLTPIQAVFQGVFGRPKKEEAVLSIVDQLIAAGAKVNRWGNRARTPLHWAAIEGYSTVASALVRAGADINARDEDGRTPLELAANDEVVQLLRSAKNTEVVPLPETGRQEK